MDAELTPAEPETLPRPQCLEQWETYFADYLANHDPNDWEMKLDVPLFNKRPVQLNVEVEHFFSRLGHLAGLDMKRVPVDDNCPKWHKFQRQLRVKEAVLRQYAGQLFRVLQATYRGTGALPAPGDRLACLTKFDGGTWLVEMADELRVNTRLFDRDQDGTLIVYYEFSMVVITAD